MPLTLPQLVPSTYVDAHGTVRELDPATRAVVSDLVIGAGLPATPVACTPGEPAPALQGELETLDGVPLGRVDGTAPDAGLYRLREDGGLTRLVVSAPASFPQPERGWGWAVQLYAARSRQSWGIGEYRDLARIARTAREAGAGSVLISPVHAAAPCVPQQSSPYSPSSRQWLQLLHIAVDEVPGAAEVDLADLAERGRALNATRLIQRDTVWEIKRTALERIWAATRDRLPVEHDL